MNDDTGSITGKKQKFTTQLQNLGHVEFGVENKDGVEMRGQLSPRYIQALFAVGETT